MIARTVSTSWQTILADLSLILFMVTASALGDASDGPLGTDKPGGHAPGPARPDARSPIMAPTPQAEPVGVWRPARGAPDLSRWLGEVARDPRLRLTITVHYAPGGRAAALAEAAQLDRAAGARGDTARIVVEPGQPDGGSAVVGYDADAGTPLARSGT